jgi:hypothetical protein
MKGIKLKRPLAGPDQEPPEHALVKVPFTAPAPTGARSRTRMEAIMDSDSELEYQHWGARLPLSARQGTVTTLVLHRRTRTQRPSSSALEGGGCGPGGV